VNDWERTLFKSIGLSRISRIIPQISDVTPSPVKEALLGSMLPSLHYLAIVATLDEALAEYVEIHNVPWPNKTKRDLFNRIKVVSGVVSSIDAVVLQEIRKRRNVIAHEPDSILSRPVTWEELDGAIGCVCLAMKELGLIGDTPQIVAFYERTPELFPNELGPSGERMRHKFIVGAKINDKVCMEFSHEISYFPPSHP
jgi:hypothetical protein